MKPLVTYTDYRTYLSDLVDNRKAQGIPASNRWFAQRMGINSTSWLTMVVKGRIGLSKVTANKLSEILRHSPNETRYFETLVFFNQARATEDRNRYYQELCALAKSKEARLVSKEQYDFYTEWYHSAVRSIIGMHGFTGDFKKLAGLVVPAITPAQARKSVELLESLKLIFKNKIGGYEIADVAITTGEEVQSLAWANFQQETMRLALEARDRFPRDKRYLGTQTVGVSAETFKAIRQLIIDTKNKIAEMAHADQSADRVYQINFQAFPLSEPPKSKESSL
ncbi:MAG: TIGR02147 family protein [Chitinivibrionales bacterium]|nr:TIGR02147 family protein [Chitinivibrionales bacterium]